jgi:hypothetical protein
MKSTKNSRIKMISYQEIARLQVAMHDSLGMQIMHRRRDTPREGEDEPEGNRLRRFLQEVHQISMRQVLGDDALRFATRPDELYNVFMIHRPVIRIDE